MATKLSQLDSVWDRIIRKFEKQPKDWVLFAAKEAERIFKDRLFNVRGGRSRDGSLLPRYSKLYLEKNKYGKRKVATHWDLSATHDLEKSIKRGIRSNTKAVIEFVDTEQLPKAEDLEKRAGTTIFKFSEKEKKEVIDETTKEVIRDIRKIIKESFK